MGFCLAFSVPDVVLILINDAIVDTPYMYPYSLLFVRTCRGIFIFSLFGVAIFLYDFSYAYRSVICAFGYSPFPLQV